MKRSPLSLVPRPSAVPCPPSGTKASRRSAKARERTSSVHSRTAIIEPMPDYLDFLARVDAWYEGVRRAHPDKVTCTKGCRDCCLGLFDISVADRDLLREGLAKADPETRRDIQSRAARILAAL